MADPWADVSGTDIWEMADHPDPFSVCDGTTPSSECQPILENDTSFTSTSHGHSTASTELFATEFSDELLNDSGDSDSCSDYTVHSNNDDDSDWEDVMEDSGTPRFQFVDPVAEMLDSAMHSGVLPKYHIFYKLISGALEYVSYNHSRGENTNGIQQWCVGPDHFFDWAGAKPLILCEALVDLMPPREKNRASQLHLSISTVLQLLCRADEWYVTPNWGTLQQVA